jgi:hypothetical protein
VFADIGTDWEEDYAQYLPHMTISLLNVDKISIRE